VDVGEIQNLVSVEDRHWWHRERRAILARELRRLPGPGRALDIGAAGGGNTRVLREHGWQALAVDIVPEGAAVARGRGIASVCSDARFLPVRSGACDLVTAFDVIEHVAEDDVVTGEISRVLRHGGTALIAVPCDMALWSAHDEACGHVRRYSRESLAAVVGKAGLVIDRMWSWNVLLRPVVAWHRRSLAGSDLSELPWPVNIALTAVIIAERYLPVHSLPGVSLMVRARRP